MAITVQTRPLHTEPEWAKPSAEYLQAHAGCRHAWGECTAQPALFELPQAVRTKHLTLTGLYAGTVLCGAARTEDADYAHAVYCRDIDAPEVCANCRAVWNAA